MKRRKKPMTTPTPMVSGTATYLLEQPQAEALLAWAAERWGAAIGIDDAARAAILYVAQTERARRYAAELEAKGSAPSRPPLPGGHAAMYDSMPLPGDTSSGPAEAP